MKEDIKTLYGKLRNAYTADNLKTISAGIISSYQKRQYDSLFLYANRLALEGVEEVKNIGKIFIKIIKNYHPDKLNSILALIEKAYRENDHDTLGSYARQIGLAGYTDRDEGKRQGRKNYDIDIEEKYVYSENDFDFHDDLYTDEYRDDETNYSDEDFDEDDEEIGTEEKEHEVFGFKEAIHEEFLGNLVDDEIFIQPEDLIELEELVLADRGIEELSGIEHCHNMTILDLSDNEIIDIGPLSKLYNLTILDLSNNCIEHITPLSYLENLVSLDLSGNDFTDIEPLASLQKLISLDISKNAIKDIGVLVNLESLKMVNLSGIRLDDKGVIEELKRKGVQVYL